jgi:hypothetical protein
LKISSLTLAFRDSYEVLFDATNEIEMASAAVPAFKVKKNDSIGDQGFTDD